MALYMRIDNLKGSTTIANYEDWIPIAATYFDVSQPHSAVIDEDSTSFQQPPHFTDLEIVKPIDSTSPQLFTYTCQSKLIKRIDIHSLKTNAHPFLQYRLDNAVISSQRLFTNEHASQTYEILTIKFKRIETKIIPQDSNQQASPAVTAGYTRAP